MPSTTTETRATDATRAAATLPAEISHVIAHVPTGLASRLARDLTPAFGAAAWSPSATRQIARALADALRSLTATPGRFIAAEDGVASAMAAAEIAPEHVERVLADLEDIYIARWA